MHRSHTKPFLAAALVLLGACSTADKGPPPASVERVGVYDGRAVVIAYVGSKHFKDWMADLRKRHDAAKAAGDQEKADALEAVAVEKQRVFHTQAFDGAGVEDILKVIEAELPAIRREAKVARLAPINAPGLEEQVKVDVTDQLVAVFEPGEKQRKWIADIRKKPFPR